MPSSWARFAICALLAAILSGKQAPAATNQGEPKPSGRLRLATCQFPVSDDIAQNAETIRRQIREARAKDAQLVQFPETALSGYAEENHETLDRLDWDLLRRETESILALAKECRVWVVLGSTHRLSEGHKPHNCLYVIHPEGRIVDRYDKRFCTIADLKHYSPGDHFVTFDVNGVRCGLLICHDYRYPELVREYARRGARLMLHSFFNSGETQEAVDRKQTAQYAQVYSSMNHLFVSYTNTSRRFAWPACFALPDGRIASTAPKNEPAVLVNDVDIHKEYDDASGAFRADALRGALHSGQCVDDPRSNDRTGF